MKPRFTLSPEAESDLDEIRDWVIAEGRSRAALYVIRSLLKAIRLLALRPELGHTRSDLTDLPVKFWPVFSYLVVYDPRGVRLRSSGCCVEQGTFNKCFPLAVNFVSRSAGGRLLPPVLFGHEITAAALPVFLAGGCDSDRIRSISRAVFSRSARRCHSISSPLHSKLARVFAIRECKMSL